jgi:hypothetical protein
MAVTHGLSSPPDSDSARGENQMSAPTDKNAPRAKRTVQKLAFAI